jgi:hypothetical protein
MSHKSVNKVAQFETFHSHWRIAKPYTQTSKAFDQEKMVNYVSHWKISESASTPSSPPSTESENTFSAVNEKKIIQGQNVAPRPLETSCPKNFISIEDSDRCVIWSLLALSAIDDGIMVFSKNQRKRPCSPLNDDTQEPALKKLCQRPSDCLNNKI